MPEEDNGLPRGTQRFLSPAPIIIAMEYAKQGWAVFPVGPDKRPWTKHGYKDATTNPTKVACFDWKGASIGIATGSSSNIDILDVDLHGGDGFETLKALGLALPDTLIASTPRQGRHYFFH